MTLKLPQIVLGDLARDTITGYTGIVVADTMWLNGCRRLTVQARELKDGKPVESTSFDVEQLELVTAAKKLVEQKTGGPHTEPTRHQEPVR